ncbi:ribulose-phosphate 3-epimerase [Fervidobacterium thailandense]|uniref:Ribulose-phosphate 3-epimerase n=1 Tax=Fervidobacterium thailandense TaxID=1008305 RepID=A0A1E3G5L9_9BACT|nr:ribulose-phosphate 3-epimerase [Fervidobacterium thailandense]ODN31153.1 ribulose-phosphate 3-epimerase [Fervidobacterium thailandense]
MVKISASILAADFSDLKGEISRVLPYIDEIHLDVMDGHFVPNLTFGYPILEAVKKLTNLPVDVHLMVTNPDDHIEKFITGGASRVTVHYETCYHLHRTISRIKELGAEAFVSINPATPVNVLEEILPYVDGVLIMTVNPGFSGQKFIPTMFEKIKKLSSLRMSKGLTFKIQVDGGVGNENAVQLAQLGVDILVMGYGVFKNEQLPTLREELLKLKDSTWRT